MSEAIARKIATNTVGQIGLRGVDIVLGVITLGLITRYLGQEGFGYYITVTAFLQFAVIIIDLGLYLTLLREISAEAEERLEFITSNIFTLRLVSTVALLGLTSIAVFFFPYPKAVQLGVFFMSFGMLFSTLISTLTALFQKYLQMIRVAAIMTFIRVLTLIASIAVIRSDEGLHALLIVHSISFAIGFGVMWLLLKKLPRPVHLRLKFNIPYLKTVMHKAWPIAVTTALNLIYFKADTIILSFYRTPGEVGLYGASYRVIEIITTFPHMFMGLVMPLLTAAWVAKNYSQLQLVWEKVLTFFAFLSFPLIAGAMIVSEDLMVLVSGSEFSASGGILRILIIASGAIFFGTLYTYMVLVVERQKQMIKYFLLTAIFALIGYFIFIPIYSYWGAAIITVLSELTIIFTASLVVRKEYRVLVPWGTLSKLALASVIMMIITNALNPYFSLVPLIAISAVAYLILAIATKAISLDDLKMLRQS